MTKELPLCKCGCGNRVKYPWNKYINHHSNKGKKLSEETKKKMSIVRKGKLKSKEHKKKLSESQKGRIGTWAGKKLSEEHKRNLSKAKQNMSDETKRKMSEAGKGRVFSEEHKKNLIEANKGRTHTTKTRRKMSKSHSGDKSHFWKGGISYLPYCTKFNWEFKERVRNFFYRTCFNCGKIESENTNRLCVHHVNYDKMVCCNEIKPLFVTLCNSCHSKTNGNRNYWEEKFTRELMERTCGNSFIPLYLMELMEDNVSWIQCLDECK